MAKESSSRRKKKKFVSDARVRINLAGARVRACACARAGFINSIIAHSNSQINSSFLISKKKVFNFFFPSSSTPQKKRKGKKINFPYMTLTLIFPSYRRFTSVCNFSSFNGMKVL